MINKLLLHFVLLFSFVNLYSQQNSILGKWKCIDDETGKAVAVVEIFEKEDLYFAKVVEIVNPKNKDFICKECPAEYKDKPVDGMVLVKNLKKKGDEYVNGTLLDPKHGKFYKCYFSLVEQDKLKVRGYIGISLFGRTQYWYRVNK